MVKKNSSSRMSEIEEKKKMIYEGSGLVGWEEEMFGIPLEEWESVLSDRERERETIGGGGGVGGVGFILDDVNVNLPPLPLPLPLPVEEEEQEKRHNSIIISQPQPQDGILARLNHIHRLSSSASSLNHLDSAILKMTAYKLFSDASPVLHFLNLTSNQPILDFLTSSNSCNSLHILDFDFGFAFGAHWASFMQELTLLHATAPPPSLTITAFSFPSSSSASSIELSLIRDNLCLFASQLSLPFQLHLDHHHSLVPPKAADLVAVNLPVWAAYAVPGLLNMVKQLSPDIVVSQDRHYEHSHATLLESLHATNLTPDALATIDNFLLLPTQRRHHSNYSTLLASAGFSPLPLSHFTQAQAQCLLLLLNASTNPSQSALPGFHLHDRHSTLSLCWRSRELVSVSAWTPSSSSLS